ncbi:MAG: CRISPR system precrRNA processing endoribonuclease RAMP protein Cas6 [Chloroflexota bacterium]
MQTITQLHHHTLTPPHLHTPTPPHLHTPTPPHPHIPLTAHHLRFILRVTNPIQFNSFKGSALRGAFADVLRRTFCAQWQREETDPLHRALCPVCQLLTVEHDLELGPWDKKPGDVRRPYAITPPSEDCPNELTVGELFEFGLTLFGEKLDYLQYLILAVGRMGEVGVGRKQRVAEGKAKRGQFVVEQIEAVNPVTREVYVMMAQGEDRVEDITLPVTHEDVMAAADLLVDQLAAQNNHLQVTFCTPTRLTNNKKTLKQPDFFALAKHAARRVLDLSAQHAGGRPDDFELRRDLYPYADTVTLVEDNTRWWDVSGYSNRINRAQRLGGFVGTVTYHAPDWRPLLPWLLWGMSTHVGKNVVKGCGIYQIQTYD